MNKVGYEKAVQAVAVPGNSEHQSGLSMDISSESARFGLSEQFGGNTRRKMASKQCTPIWFYTTISKKEKKE